MKNLSDLYLIYSLLNVIPRKFERNILKETVHTNYIDSLFSTLLISTIGVYSKRPYKPPFKHFLLLLSLFCILVIGLFEECIFDITNSVLKNCSHLFFVYVLISYVVHYYCTYCKGYGKHDTSIYVCVCTYLEGHYLFFC